jgi:hypothetical protein
LHVECAELLPGEGLRFSSAHALRPVGWNSVGTRRARVHQTVAPAVGRRSFLTPLASCQLPICAGSMFLARARCAPLRPTRRGLLRRAAIRSRRPRCSLAADPGRQSCPRAAIAARAVSR